MIETIVAQSLFLVALAIVASLLSQFSRIEVGLACVATGFVGGQMVGVFGFDTGIRAHNLEDVIFFVILPVLVFEGAWHIRPAQLRQWLAPIVLLASVGVMVGTAATAIMVYAGIGHPTGFPLIAALLTGAILAATDPSAVTAQLRELGAPGGIAIIFDGEGLFNDATAVVVFSLVLAVALGPAQPPQAGLLLFLRVFFGGVLIGLAVGGIAAWVARRLASAAATTVVLLFAAFAGFFLAESLAEVSGIMAVVSAALLSRYLLDDLDTETARGLSFTWGWASTLLNHLLFVLMGLVITLGMFESRWLAMLIAIAAVLIARVAVVLVCGLLAWPMGRRLPWAWQGLLVWGGQRGAIALALVLSLPIELDYWYTIQSMVFGVVLFSLLVQGTTTPALIRRLAPA